MVSKLQYLIILRHEKTKENIQGIVQGQAIGGELASEDVDPQKIKWCKDNLVGSSIIVSSNSPRAVRSAQIFTKTMKIPLRISFLFQQRRWGRAEGRPLSKLGGAFVKNAFLAGVDKLGPTAESLSEVSERAAKAWRYIQGIPARTVLVISHDEFSNYLINTILREGLFKRPLGFNEAHIIEYVGDKVVNVTLHATVTRVPIKHHIVCRSDATGFIIDSVGVRILKNRGISLYKESKNLSHERIEGVIIGDQPFIDKHLYHYPNLKVIARFGKGVDAVKITPRSGLRLTNTPHCNERSVAEFTISCILNLIRREHWFNVFGRQQQSGTLVRPCGVEWRQFNVGVIGLGDIGREVAQILYSMGFAVKAWTAHPKLHRKFLTTFGIPFVSSIKKLCSWADLITIHVKGNIRVIGLSELKAMRLRRGYIINTARARSIDRKASLRALEKKWISGVISDTWPTDSSISTKMIKKFFLDQSLIISPHIAGKTVTAFRKAIALTAYNIAWVLSGRPERAKCVDLYKII